MQQSEDPLKTQVSPGAPPDSTSPRWPGPSPAACLPHHTQPFASSHLLVFASPVPSARSTASDQFSCILQVSAHLPPLRDATWSSQLPHCQHCPPSDGQWPPGSQLACGVMGSWVRPGSGLGAAWPKLRLPPTCLLMWVNCRHGAGCWASDLREQAGPSAGGEVSQHRAWDVLSRGPAGRPAPRRVAEALVLPGGGMVWPCPPPQQCLSLRVYV